MAIARTLESLEHMCEPALAAWSFLYTVTRCGNSSPPLDLGRKSRLGSAERARPHYLFRNLVAMGWRWFCNQEIGRSEMDRSQVRRGQMLTLMHTHTHTCARTHARTHTQHMHAQTHARTHMHARTHAHTHTHTHTCRHAHTDTHTHTHTHTHTGNIGRLCCPIQHELDEATKQ